jgi:hypothetical protein
MIAAFGEVLIGDPRNDRDMLQGGMQGTQCHRWIHIPISMFGFREYLSE